MSSDPKTIVEEYLKSNGYAFEMRVAKEFQAAGFGITQAFYYQDSVSHISREIDLIAMFQKKIQGIAFNIVFIIECKYAKTPWVLFTGKVGLANNAKNYCADFAGKKWIEHLAKQLYFDDYFQSNRAIGYGLSVTEKRDEDAQKNNAYKAIQTLLSFLKSDTKDQTFSKDKSYNLYVPIIAIKGKLFEAFLSDVNEIITQEINEGQLIYKESIDYIIPKIHIVTEDALESFVKRLYDDCERLFTVPYLNIELITDYKTHGPVIL